MAAEIPTYDKLPSELLDYSVDWTEWLAGSDGTLGDSINASSWIFPATVPDTTLVDFENDLQEGVATKWIGGGTVGRIYVVTNEIDTKQGRHASRSFKIYVVASR